MGWHGFYPFAAEARQQGYACWVNSRRFAIVARSPQQCAIISEIMHAYNILGNRIETLSPSPEGIALGEQARINSAVHEDDRSCFDFRNSQTCKDASPWSSLWCSNQRVENGLARFHASFLTDDLILLYKVAIFWVKPWVNPQTWLHGDSGPLIICTFVYVVHASATSMLCYTKMWFMWFLWHGDVRPGPLWFIFMKWHRCWYAGCWLGGFRGGVWGVW